MYEMCIMYYACIQVVTGGFKIGIVGYGSRVLPLRHPYEWQMGMNMMNGD